MWKPKEGLLVSKAIRKLQRCIREFVETAQKGESQNRAYNVNLHDNVEVAAQHLLHGMLLSSGILNAYAVSHNGERVRLTPSMFFPERRLPDYDKSMVQAKREAGYSEGAFGPRLFLSGSWVEVFHSSPPGEPFRPTLGSTVELSFVVNRRVSVIDLDFLRRLSDVNYVSDIESIPAEITETKWKEIRAADARVLMKHYSPIEGWAVVIEGSLDPTDYMQTPPVIKVQRNIVSEIIRLIEEDPRQTKDSIRRAHFPDVSVRKFRQYWGQASEEVPWISAPGRKRAKS